MAFKLLLFLLFLMILETYQLLKEGIAEHKYAFGIIKILILNTLFISILSVKSFYMEIFLKIKKAIPPIIRTAAKVLTTPLKSPSNNQY